MTSKATDGHRLSTCNEFLRLCKESDMDTVLEASCSREMAVRMVMLQGSGSFFAYEPVLKALQRAEMPLQHLLPLPASKEDAKGKQSLRLSTRFHRHPGSFLEYNVT